MDTLKGIPGEFRSAWRGLASAPAFSALVVVTVALSMGPTTAVYSLANWLLLRPLPGVSDAEGLGFVRHGVAREGGLSPRRITYPNLLEITTALETIEALGATQGGTATLLWEEGRGQPVPLEFVTPEYFDALALRPSAGRFFNAAEDDPTQGGAMVAVVSHSLATTRFASADAAIGAEFSVNRHTVEIIGVLPPGFHGLTRIGQTDLWLPGASHDAVRNFSRANGGTSRDDGIGFYEFVARLAPGFTWEQAEAELGSLAAGLAERYPEANEGLSVGTFVVYPRIGNDPLRRDMLARSLRLLMFVTASVLLVGCSNVTNLLLMRAIDRRGEICLHKALGARSSVLVRRGLLEAMTLCAIGAVAGLALARFFLSAIEGSRLGGMFQPISRVETDSRVVAFTAGLCVVVALGASILPALWISRADPARWIAGAGSRSKRRSAHWRTALIALQLAIGVPLVIGALLFSSTLAALAEVDPGVRPGTVRLLVVNTGDQGYSPAEVSAYQRDLLDALQGETGVDSVVMASAVPVACCAMYTFVADPKADVEGTPLTMPEFHVTRGYFDMLGIPVLQGRTFRPDEQFPAADAEADVVIVSQSVARHLFDDDTPIGKVVRFPIRGRKGRDFRVVGVVGDVLTNDLVEPAPHIVYLPFGAGGFAVPQAWLLVDGEEPAAVADTAMKVGAQVDPLLPLLRMDRSPGIREALESHLSERVLLGRLFTSLGIVALALAALGVYGATGRAVSARRREIGVRMALGANGARVVGTTLRGALGALLAGAFGGAGLSIFSVRLIEGYLYGVSRLDPATWCVALAVLVVVGGLAAAVPARRAVLVEPAEALRQ